MVNQKSKIVLSPYLKILRLPNLAIIILSQLMLRYFVIGTFLDLSAMKPVLSIFNFGLLVLSTLLIAAGGYVINDYFDIEIDKQNKPEKRIVGNLIPVKSIMSFYWALTIPGVIIGFFVAYQVDYFLLGFIFPLVAIMLWYYSSKYQKTILWGNLSIALLSALVILIVWLFEFFALRSDPIIYIDALKQIKPISFVVVAFAIFAFLVTLVREILKDIEDVEGDQNGDYKTLAIVKGKTKSRNVAIFIHVATFLFLAVCQYFLYQYEFKLVFWYLMVAVQSLFVFVLYYMVKANTKDEFHFLSTAMKIIMVAGILSMQIFYITY